ncbi:unnamed protein product [Oikopleura dioica]|uniref:Protein kinase domain-containing protein n=1 Tax=Oikopleura dioica TaxID=34765 RepID=E4YYN1_OIKDI|nr:unnamed protein product [Oikopleura dioica]
MKDQFFIDYDETVLIHRKSKNKSCSDVPGANATRRRRIRRCLRGQELLKIEYKIYTKLHNRKSTRLAHFAFFHRFQSEVELAYKYRPNSGINNGRLEPGRAFFNILALEQLGPDLDKILRFAKRTNFCKINNHLNRRNKGLSFTTVVNIGEQLFSGLQYLHEKGIIHRDIKPLNICAGRGQRSKNIFIVDFGLSKIYKYGDNLMEDEHYLGPGTSMYKSINITKGSSGQSAVSSASLRDDCISAVYVLLEMYRGSLWWSQLDPKQQAEKVHEMKKEWLDENNWKEKFEELLPLCRIMEELHVTDFNEMPPYKKIEKELDELKNHKYYRKEELDWIIKENGFGELWTAKKSRKSN